MQGGTFFFALLLVITGGTTVVGLETTPSPDIGLTEAPPCNSSRDCLSCSDNPGCGWCDVTQECLAGTEFGANDTICTSWFYYGCFSVGDTASCSEHIADMSCDLTHCDETRTNFNPDVCVHCRSVEACFEQDTGFCPSWNEAKCPDGVPAKNDSVPHRNVVQVAENVKAVDPTETCLYTCPVSFPPEYGEGATLLVAPNPTGFEVGDTVVSGQAGGIMHTVDSITPQGAYAFVMASAANLEDVISYIDFQGPIDPVPIEDKTTTEHIPDEDLLYSALNEDLQDYGTFHAVQDHIDVYKCTGGKYINGLGEEWTSTFFVMKRSEFEGFFAAEGDVLVGNSSVGWLETVTDISSSGDFSYVETKLVNCAEMLPDANRLNLASGSEWTDEAPDLHCQGGDNTDGLMVYNGQRVEDLNYQTGDTVVGRNSGPFMSKVMSWTEVGDFVFIEASPMSDLNGTSTSNSTSLTRRRRELFVGFEYGLSATIKRTLAGGGDGVQGPGGVTFSGEAAITAEPYFKVRVGLELDLDWGWSSPFIHKAEAKFVGRAGFGLKLKAEVSGSVKKSWTKTLEEGTIPPKICLPIIWFLCIPARLRYVVNLTLEVSATISATLETKGKAEAGVELGAVWRHGRGVTPIFDADLTFEGFRKADSDAKLSGKVEAKGSLTPTLIFDLPAPGIPINIPSRWLRRLLPDWLTGAKSSGPSAITLFSPKLEMPVIAEVAAEFCFKLPLGLPALEKIEWKAGMGQTIVSVKIGLGDKLSVELKETMRLGWEIGDTIDFPYCNSTNATTTPPPTTVTHLIGTGSYYASTIPYDTTTTPYNTTTTPYDTTTTPYDTTTTPYDTTTTPYDTTTTPYDTTTTPYETTTPYDTTPTPYGGTGSGTSDNCTVDLVFLIDGSSKIGRARFEEAKIYIGDVVECLNLTETQVGVIQFHCESKWEISLGEYTDNMQLQNAIMADVIFEGGTPSRVGLALRHMKATTPFRDNARKVAVVLTDGRFGGAYAGRAQEARDAGIEIYGVAVGRTASIQISGLNAITGNPGRVVHWQLMDPCMFAALLCSG